MPLRTLVAVVLALMAIQLVVIIVVSAFNRRYFDGRPAAEYALAMRDLARDKPLAALVIKACWMLWVVEFLVVVVAKYVARLPA